MNKKFHFSILFFFLLSACGAAPPTPGPTSSSNTEVDIATWIREHAMEISTDDPEAGNEDLLPLKDIIGDARIVALGEQTHGTHEFFTMRHRLIRFLVEEMGFTILAVEAPWSPGHAVNAYIHGADLDGQDALLGMDYWTFATEESLEMIDWMRDYNQSRLIAEQINFYGLTAHDPLASKETILPWLESFDPELAQKSELALQCINFSYQDAGLFYQRTDEEKSLCKEAAEGVYNAVAENRAEFLARISLAEYSQLLQELRVLRQSVSVLSGYPDSHELFDIYMAENVSWILDQAGEDAKIIIWAHNGHIAYVPERLGGILKEMYGNEMINIATDFYEGTFTARVRDSDPENWWDVGLIGVAKAAQSPKYSYSYYLNLAGLPYLILDLRNVDYSVLGAGWLEDVRGFRTVGAYVFSHDIPNRNFAIFDLPETFDVVMFVRESTPSQPLILLVE